MELTRSFMSKLALLSANLIHLDANSIHFKKTRSNRTESTPQVIPAHSKVRSLTVEPARSFLHATCSFWYASSLSLCHEFSNDMLHCILFFIVGCNSTKMKNLVIGSYLEIVRARVRKKSDAAQPSNFWSAKLTHVRNAQQCATSYFDAVFCYRPQIRSAFPKKFGIFPEPLKVAQYLID